MHDRGIIQFIPVTKKCFYKTNLVYLEDGWPRFEKNGNFVLLNFIHTVTFKTGIGVTK